MSPKTEDDIRKLILERRARFLAAALTTTGLQACSVDSGPSVCLTIAVTPSTFDPSSSTTAAGSGTATATNASTTATTSQLNSCRNPPACVCLSIAVSHPEISPVAPVDTTTSETNASTLESQDASAPITPGDAGSDAGEGADAAPDGGTTTAQSASASTATGEISQALTEPSVCLSILANKRN